MGTKSMLTYKRRLKVRKMYLQGYTPQQMADDLGVKLSTIKSDIRKINQWYTAAVEKNGHILEKQAEYILKHLDELKLIKQKLWEIESKADTDKDKIDALKSILNELSHEARVLKLIDVSKTINNYISIDKIGIIVNTAIDVIKEFVPLEKQKYALERLKNAGRNIIEVNSNG